MVINILFYKFNSIQLYMISYDVLLCQFKILNNITLIIYTVNITLIIYKEK
jgi:hypothetical protein